MGYRALHAGAPGVPGGGLPRDREAQRAVAASRETLGANCALTPSGPFSLTQVGSPRRGLLSAQHKGFGRVKNGNWIQVKPVRPALLPADAQ